MEPYVDIALIGLAGMMIVIMILLIIVLVRINKMNKRYRNIVGNATVDNVDDLLMSLQDRLLVLEENESKQADAIKDIRRVIGSMKGHLAVKRYKAFSDQGSDLSFSVALLDEGQNGIVLTGIHNREETYLYAKPVENGHSSYSLSPEEKEVIAQTAAAKSVAPHAAT